MSQSYKNGLDLLYKILDTRKYTHDHVKDPTYLQLRASTV